MRLLITGADGFVGRWLAPAAAQRGWDVFAGCLRQPTSPPGRGVPASDRVTWLPLDVCDSQQIHRAIYETRPHAIVHLAAISHVPAAEADPVAAYDVNTIGIARLIDALYRERDAGALATRLLVVGSAEQYGSHPLESMPLTEDSEQRPVSTYAATKSAQEFSALQAWRRWNLRVILARAFPSSGPGHDARFLLPSLIQRAHDLPITGGELVVGNRGTIRDYLHVSDVVEAYLDLLLRGEPGVAYNVCSGKGISVEEVAERVLAISGKAAAIVSDPALQRSADIPVLVGSNERLTTEIGWRPTRAFDDIIRDLQRSLFDQTNGALA
jgi:GDP-4-dehydro-6-deoxy-D-mannose reductase